MVERDVNFLQLTRPCNVSSRSDTVQYVCLLPRCQRSTLAQEYGHFKSAEFLRFLTTLKRFPMCWWTRRRTPVDRVRLLATLQPRQ